MPDLQPNLAEADIDVAATTACAVCPHPWEAHDAISVRYCTATTVSGSSRGCVCPGGTSSEKPKPDKEKQ